MVVLGERLFTRAVIQAFRKTEPNQPLVCSGRFTECRIRTSHPLVNTRPLFAVPYPSKAPWPSRRPMLISVEKRPQMRAQSKSVGHWAGLLVR